MNEPRPIIGITVDRVEDRLQVAAAYCDRVVQHGGAPILLPCVTDDVKPYLDLCHGFILTGGDDPEMTPFGEATHLNAKPIHPMRQRFELALLDALRSRPEAPVLGVCLGMQLMALHEGGRLDQHLPDTLATSDDHFNHRSHPINGELGEGIVHSHHRQAIRDPGSMRVVAAAPDGVIEAVRHRDRPYYLGVQWHPERTAWKPLGDGLFGQLIEHARSHQAATH